MFDTCIDRGHTLRYLGVPLSIPMDHEKLYRDVPLCTTKEVWAAKRENRDPVPDAVSTVVITQPQPHKGHRVLAVCPTCEKVIPLGRMHQHYRVHKKATA